MKFLFGIILFLFGTFTPSSPIPESQDPNIKYPINLQFETLHEGQTTGSRFEAGQYLIKDEDRLRSLYSRINVNITNKVEIPSINYREEMVIGVFAGEQNSGGQTLKITKITEKVDVIEVSIDQTIPGPECMVIQMITSPHHIVKTKKSDKAIRYETNVNARNC